MEGVISVTYRHITIEHYKKGDKYYVWEYIENHPEKTISECRVNGIKKFLTEDELKVFIDKTLKRCGKENSPRFQDD